MARFEAAPLDYVNLYPMPAATPDALYELGLDFALGRDVAIDLVEAHKWLNIAALKGNADAKRMRIEIAAEMARSELIEAQRLARAWLQGQ